MDSPTARKKRKNDSSDDTSRKKGGQASGDEASCSVSGKEEEGDAKTYLMTGLDETFLTKVVLHFRTLMRSTGVLMPEIIRYGSGGVSTASHPLYQEITATSSSCQEYQDFTIRCQKEVIDFKVHKCVLAKKSDFFRTMFNAGMTESDNSIMDLSPSDNEREGGDATTAAEMELFLYFFYIPETFSVHLLDAFGLKNSVAWDPILTEEKRQHTEIQQILWTVNSMLRLADKYAVEDINEGIKTTILCSERIAKEEPCLLLLVTSRYNIRIDQSGYTRASISCSTLRKIDANIRDGLNDVVDRDIRYLMESESWDQEIRRFALIFGHVGSEIEKVITAGEKMVKDMRDARCNTAANVLLLENLRNLARLFNKEIPPYERERMKSLAFTLGAYTK